MKIYYLQSQYAPAKHRIVKVLYDDDAFKFDESVLSPFLIAVVDELDPSNKPLCLDLYRTQNRVDAGGEGKHHVNELGELIEKVGWSEALDGAI